MDLFRLTCYIKCTLHCRVTSWVGDKKEDVLLTQYYDADLASDIPTHRSTSASYEAIWGPHALELGSLWDRNDKRVFPTVHSRLILSLLTMRCARSCLRHYRFGKYCLTDQCDVYCWKIIK
eukprot:8759432-Pyramimonas_sp.AAC.1